MVVQSFTRWELVQKIIKNATGMNQEPMVWRLSADTCGMDNKRNDGGEREREKKRERERKKRKRKREEDDK